ncbi:tetratricopeptide repeat protein [Shewanella donghaensis]|uniref:tetratricopeptide repeat protein n=1 Tax=Shewanella donghaensis TaxID=238836 RepID=UPI001184429C|nr:tetratricopeptide repeat protein [Shewanella donghaensis]
MLQNNEASPEISLYSSIVNFRTISLCFCLIFSFIFSGCSSTSTSKSGVAKATVLYNDSYFRPVMIPTTAEVFELPEEMVTEIQRDYARSAGTNGQKKAINLWLAEYINAQDGGFEYRDHYTRMASVTALERAGNCMSLVILSTAIAEAFNVPVKFQDIDVEPIWDRRGGFYLVNGHVNMKLLHRDEPNTINIQTSEILVDFLPERSVRAYRTKKISRETLAGMYFNNVAAEALVRNDYDLAYALIKRAIDLDPYYVNSINTLAVIYRHKGLDAQAETAYRHVLKLESENVTTLYNLAIILGEQNRLEEWKEVHKVLELARINNPFYYFDMAQQAYFEKQYQEALVWYKRAVERADYRHEFYFGLSRAYWATGDERRAKKSMEKAIDLSLDVNNQHRYKGKLQAMMRH